MDQLWEQLDQAAIIHIGGKDILFSKNRIHSVLEKLSLSSKEKNQLKGSLSKHFGSKGERKMLLDLLTRCKDLVSFPSFCGVTVGRETFHYLQEPCRMRHILGLADAVHMSMSNLGVNVRFPTKILARVHGDVGESFRIRSLYRENTGCPIGRSSDRERIIVNRSTTHNRKFHLVLHYLRVFPHHLEEKSYVSLIKENLVDTFCVQMNQERPSLSFGNIPLFPEMTQKRLDRLFRNSRKNRVRFYKNLLESKSLCAPVGDDMILSAYIKHKASLCRPQEDLLKLSEEDLRGLYDYGQRVGRFVSKVYDPYKTRLPNTRATVERPRHLGGARGGLSQQISVARGPMFLRHLHGPTRMEPFVIGLFGRPGCGKTTTIASLKSLLQMVLFPEVDLDDLVYSRSCSAKHWDGYRGQPIVVLDDFGQDLVDRSDLAEFEQLVSTNEYILPMAELSEKGTRFTSPIIIVTSNMAFGSPISSPNKTPILEDDLALWRRFHLPFLLRKVDGSTLFQEYILHPFIEGNKKYWDQKEVGVAILHRATYCGAAQWHERNPPQMFSEKKFSSVVPLSRHIVDCFRSHSDFHARELSGTWKQEIGTISVDYSKRGSLPVYDLKVKKIGFAQKPNDFSISTIFPRFPPFHPPIVEAVALKEPLKVRMITKAEKDTKVLQPFQEALFKYLMSRPQFVLTHGVMFGKKEEFREKLEWIYRIESEIKSILSHKKDDDLWLSGDYTAATDNFPMSATNALVEGILSQIDHEPTRAWVRYEVSPHIIKYPFGIGDGVQTSGQLMGSLLSFPLLCFLNDYIVSKSGFEDGKYLINGDDVVALGPQSVIDKWRESAPCVGLSLSLGKNFVDKEFCCVNSQLFFNGDVLHTGKVSLSTRYGKTLSRCYAESQFYYGSNPDLRREFIRRNYQELRKTPRSLDIPVTHGGLGLFFEGEVAPNERDLLVYLTDYLGQCLKSEPVPGDTIRRSLRVPLGIFSDEDMVLAGGEPIEGEREFDLLSMLETNPRDPESKAELGFSDIEETSRVLRSSESSWFGALKSFPLDLFPPIGTLRTRRVLIDKGKIGFIKSRILDYSLYLLYKEVSGGVLSTDHDPEKIFISWCRDSVFDESDPLFGSLTLPPEVVSEILKEDQEELIRYSNLLPDLSPKLVTNDWLGDDLGKIVAGELFSGYSPPLQENVEEEVAAGYHLFVQQG
nr:MAG: putative RNA-dependent RNA polymerase [Narnaviridae sp.]